MTVPAIATWDDWAFDLCDSNGAPIYYLNADIRDFEGTAVPGATAHRLESCSFRMSGECGAAAYIDPTVIQFIRITPYGDPTRALWGIIGKPKQEYGPRGEASIISVSCVGIEYLLHSRQCYHYDGSTIGWITVTGGVDDFLKELVRQTAVAATCGNDVDGNSRAWSWGTLVVAANTTAGTVDTYREGEGYLDEVIASYAKRLGVGWELRPTVSGGAVTFTFATAVPNNGTDKSTGASRVIINDFAQTLIPAGARWRDWQGLITDMHGRGYMLVSSDTTLRTAWGRWEGACNETVHNQVDLQLTQFGLKEGAEFTFEASAATGGACRWMAEYEVGDIVLRNNTRLGIASSAETIAGIKFTFPNRVLKLEIRWGEKEPTQQQKQQGKYHRLPPGIPVFPRYGTPVAVGAANAMGTTANNDMVTGDHVHKSVVTVGAQTVSPDSGVTTFVAGTGMTLTGNSPADHQITFASSVTGGCYWDRDANGGDPYLFQRTAGDDVFLIAAPGAAAAPQFKVYVSGGDETYHLDGTGNIHGAKNSAGNGQAWVGAYGSSGTGGTVYRDLLMHGHDLGIHDIEISGNIVSIPSTTASRLVWLGGSNGEDAIWCHQIAGYVENSSGDLGDTEPATKRWLLDNTGLTLYTGAGNTTTGRWDRSDGNLAVIKSLSYTWPAAHAAGYLYNNGAGALSYSTPAACVWTDDGTYVYPTNAGRNLRIRDSGGTAVVSISGSTGAGNFAGALTTYSGVVYLGDTSTYWQRVSGSSLTRLVTDMGNIYLTHATNSLLFYNGAFAPLTQFKLGDTSYRWSNVYSVLGSFSGQISSSLATGTAPFAPTSTTVCTNLNADMVDGFHASEASDVNKIPVRDASQYIYASGFAVNVNYYLRPAATGTALAIAGDISMTGKSVYGTALVNGSYHVTPAATGTAAAFAGDITATGKSVYANALVNGSYHITPGAATAANLNGSVTCTALTASTGNVTVTAGNIVLSAGGATVDGVDLSAFKSAYDSHYHHFTPAGSIGSAAITLSGKTEDWAAEGSATEGTYLYRWSGGTGTRVYVDSTGHVVTTTGSGELALGTGFLHHTHLLTGGTYGTGAASQATHAFTGTADIHTGTPL